MWEYTMEVSCACSKISSVNELSTSLFSLYPCIVELTWKQKKYSRISMCTVRGLEINRQHMVYSRKYSICFLLDCRNRYGAELYII